MSHRHPHPHDATAEAPLRGLRGPAVLDIGGDVGALVVQLEPRWLGREIEVEPADAPGPRVHTDALRRGTGCAAVFAQLTAGRYLLLDGERRVPVVVHGGVVTEVDARAR